MFKHLLVPLDGSKLAESVLPAVRYLAEIGKASVTLIHVMEYGAGKEIHGDRHLTEYGEACNYLNRTAQHYLPKGLEVQCHVHREEERHVARSIVQHSHEYYSDLIMLCTHGRRGMRDLLFGSIAHQVIAYGTCPGLVIRPEWIRPSGDFSLSQLLVPLDGNPQHEQCLPLAADLAQACGAALHLLMVVPEFENLTDGNAAAGRLLPGTAMAMLDLAEQEAEVYLRERCTHLRSTGMELSGEVSRGDPASGIVGVAQRLRADLIVLGTHGKTATDAFWSGSLTPRIAAKTAMPLLLIPVSRAEDRAGPESIIKMA